MENKLILNPQMHKTEEQNDWELHIVKCWVYIKKDQIEAIKAIIKEQEQQDKTPIRGALAYGLQKKDNKSFWAEVKELLIAYYFEHRTK